ncbi:MAG: branched-chain amino acid transporter permease [Moraxella sp.]|nr:branched-chain amino acid transporter permease [Moraxella sp.]
MTLTEQVLTILTAIVAVQLCRWVAFWVFPAHKKVPDFVQYLGKALPSAVFGLLVVYCYKNVDILGQYHGMAEFIAGAVVVGLHLWRKNMFISIGAGTVLYMILVQKVFV